MLGCTVTKIGAFLVRSYLEAIDSGKIANTAAPAIAIDYWRLPKDAKLRDVVLAVRADEAHHRDVNHYAAVSTQTLIIS